MLFLFLFPLAFPLAFLLAFLFLFASLFAFLFLFLSMSGHCVLRRLVRRCCASSKCATAILIKLSNFVPPLIHFVFIGLRSLRAQM